MDSNKTMMLNPSLNSEPFLLSNEEEENKMKVNAADGSESDSSVHDNQLLDIPVENDDASWGFFQVGRDFESMNVTHKFTRREKERMKLFESLDYRAPLNEIFKRHIENHDDFNVGNKWLAFGLIGITTGFIAFSLKESIETVVSVKTEYIRDFLKEDKIVIAYIFSILYQIIFALLATVLVVLVEPVAGGSGVPDVMGFLNGVKMPCVFDLRTAIVKFFSCFFCVSSGLPVGPEGPMIHLGACVGAGLTQGQSRSLGFTTNYFKKMRNSKDKRDLITGGAAAGVSAAFGAPVGGLLFAMEEVSSFWEQSLTWMIFFGTMMSTFAANLFLSGFEDWVPTEEFGIWKDSATILFQITRFVRFHIAAVPAVLLLGAIGGSLGTIFTFFNLKINRFRNRFITPFKVRRISEVVFIMILFGSAMFFLPFSYDCINDSEVFGNNLEGNLTKKVEIFRFRCEEDEYNPLAALTYGGGDNVIKLLFDRETNKLFHYGELFIFLIFYFAFACWVAGSAISSGLVVPMLLIGAVTGRIVGIFLSDIFGHGSEFLNPGVFALLGAAAFFGGVSRLTISLTVIMLEISNDVHMLLPIMLSVMIAKRVADYATHSLYHAILEMKCVPFLDFMPVLKKLDLFSAQHIMAYPVRTVTEVIKVRDLLNVLLSCKHNGFPVVSPFFGHLREQDIGGKPDEETDNNEEKYVNVESHRLKKNTQTHFEMKPKKKETENDNTLNALKSGKSTNHMFLMRGMVLRSHLMMLLRNPNCFQKHHSDHKEPMSFQEILDNQDDLNRIPREELSKLLSPLSLRLKLTEEHLDMYINLKPYVNTSSVTVCEQFSLQLTYNLFRSMGLRHLPVVNGHNEVVGIITRKDLVGQNIEEKIEEYLNHLD